MNPLIIAHRGASGEAPENTLAAFDRAVELGADLIEFDVRLSRDEHVVVIHDETVNRTTNGRGFVSDLTLEELKGLDAGSWFSSLFLGERIPALDETLELIKPTCAGALIEMKSGPADATVEVIQGHEMQSRVIVTSFDHQEVKRVKQLDSLIATAALIDYRPVDVALEANLVGAKTVAIHWKFVTPELVRNAHQHALRVFVWTINDPVNARKMVDLGADGIITDYPGASQG